MRCFHLCVKQELTSDLPDGQHQVSEMVNETRIAADARQKSMPFFLRSFFSLTMTETLPENGKIIGATVAMTNTWIWCRFSGADGQGASGTQR